MIEKKTVCQIVDEWLEDKEYFLVEVIISPDDKIVVEIDHKEGVWIGGLCRTEPLHRVPVES